LANALISPDHHHEHLNFKLSGVGIGDGWTHPVDQVATYSEYSYAAGVVDEILQWEIQFLES